MLPPTPSSWNVTRCQLKKSRHSNWSKDEDPDHCDYRRSFLRLDVSSTFTAQYIRDAPENIVNQRPYAIARGIAYNTRSHVCTINVSADRVSALTDDEDRCL